MVSSSKGLKAVRRPSAHGRAMKKLATLPATVAMTGVYVIF